MTKLLSLMLTAFVLLAPASGVAAVSAPHAIPAPYTNCSKFNAKYPHGVGRANAKDKTKSKTAKPVTTFKRKYEDL